MSKTDSNTIAVGIIKAYFGIISIGILASLVLCVFAILCMLLTVSQIKVTPVPPGTLHFGGSMFNSTPHP